MGGGGAGREAMTADVRGGGVEDPDPSWTESCRERVPALTVLIDGDGGVAVSEDVIVGAATGLRRAR